MQLIQKVKKSIQDDHLFGRGHTVIVGVSGGPDSVALAHILHALQYQLSFHLHFAHFNHHFHRNANADQKFVENLAEQLNIPCSVGHWKNSKLFKKSSFEDAARRRRIQFFSRLAKKINAQAIVLAHTKDDLAETVLMRILRGTGLQGLRGILPKRNLGTICVVRPLLKLKKKDILTFLKKRGIVFRTDPTNAQTKFFRNRIRIKLLPLLAKDYNRNITELLTNLIDNISTDYNYIRQQSQKLSKKLVKYSRGKKRAHIDLGSFSKEHPALQRMLVRNVIKQFKGDTNRFTMAHFKEIEDLVHRRPTGTIVHLPKNIRIRKNSRSLILEYN